MSLLRKKVPAAFLGIFVLLMGMWPMLLAEQCRAMCRERAAALTSAQACPMASAKESERGCCHQAKSAPIAPKASAGCCAVGPECPLSKPLTAPQLPSISNVGVPDAALVDAPRWLTALAVPARIETPNIVSVEAGPDPPTQASLCTYRC